MAIKVREKKLANGRISLILDHYNNGSRFNEKTGIYLEKSDPKETRKDKRQQAELMRSQRQLESVANANGLPQTSKRKVTLLRYWNAFNDRLEISGKRKYVAAFKHFVEFDGNKKTRISAITPKYADQFAQHLIDKGLTGETPFDYFKKFQTVLLAAVDDGIINKSPVKPKTIERRSNDPKEILTQDELKLLINTDHCEVRRAFLFACYTGCGRAEIIDLKWKDIKKNVLRTNRKKNGNTVKVPLHPTAIAMLGKMKKKDEIIFSLPSTTTVKKKLKRWMEEVGIDKEITFYCGRHTFAVSLLRAGANLKTVANLMAQKDISSTTKYLNYLDDMEQTAIDNLPILT